MSFKERRSSGLVTSSSAVAASIATVARLTGFGHPENLRRSFQKHLSVSPREFYQRFG